MDTYGNALRTSTLGAGFTQWATGSFTARKITLGYSNAWRTIGIVVPSGLVNASRQVETALYVPNDYTTASDYDISYVRLVATYKVLV